LQETYRANLPESLAQLFSYKSPNGGDNAEPSRKTKELELYDALGVPMNASTEDIRKAYIHKSLRSHPDRNPTDPRASDSFQLISEAYHILVDDSLRAEYDRGSEPGKTRAFFLRAFGSEAFEPLVGEMLGPRLSIFRHDVKTTDDYAEIEIEMGQWQREVSIARNLCAILDPYVATDWNEGEFRASIAKQCTDLATLASGRALMATIGYVYCKQAIMELGGISGAIASMRSVIHTM
jgi:hypothetical protein